MKSARIAFALLFACCNPVGWAEDASDGSWSAELLGRILKADPTNVGGAVAAPAQAEMILRTYRLMHLRVGEAGKPQNVLAILSRLLPPGSIVNPDPAANSLHVLTTAAAHQAVWDYLSAVDIAEPAAPPVSAGIPDDVRTALGKLASADERSARLLTALGTLKSDVAHELARIDARQHERTLDFLVAVSVSAVVLAATVGWLLRRRAAAHRAAAEPATLVVVPEQLTHALTPVHEKMRSDMLGLLNEVAIKLQAQHNEQQKLVREQHQQLEEARVALAEERRQFISEAGSMVVQAVERVDATTTRLARQQDKVAELVEELQDTVRELDQTKDHLRKREIELEQERAKIAALSILLEEGGTPASASGNGGRVAFAHPNGSPSELVNLCTPPNPSPVDPQPDRTPSAPRSEPRFQFLPPDQSES